MPDAKGLEYEVSGDGEPVLLIHGSYVAAAFLPLTRERPLADRYRLVRYHRRGYAGSAPLSGPFLIEDQARDALALLEHLGVERAHVVGHSYGGVIALQLALDAPQAVHSLALLEPPLAMVPSARAFFEGLAPARERYAAGDLAGAVDGFMSVACGPDWRGVVARAVPGGVEQAEKDAAIPFEVESPALEAWKFDAERASHISQPVLHVVGTESRPLFHEGAQLVRSWVPQTETLSVPGVDHLLQMRDPAPVATGIADFLARHPL